VGSRIRQNRHLVLLSELRCNLKEGGKGGRGYSEDREEGEERGGDEDKDKDNGNKGQMRGGKAEGGGDEERDKERETKART
jgi:hypothetical protein